MQNGNGTATTETEPSPTVAEADTVIPEQKLPALQEDQPVSDAVVCTVLHSVCSKEIT
jgi:hypothetical protein